MIELVKLTLSDYGQQITVEFLAFQVLYEIKLSKESTWIKTWAAIIRAIGRVIKENYCLYIPLEDKLRIFHTGMCGVEYVLAQAPSNINVVDYTEIT